MFHSDTDIERIGRGITDRTLPKAEWTHAAHWAGAVWLIRHPDYHAETDMPGIIRAYNTACGVPNTDTEGYHETITLASLIIARAFLRKHPDDTPSYLVVNDLLASGYDRSDWIFCHWSRDKLFSVAARRSWASPDLAPLSD